MVSFKMFLEKKQRNPLRKKELKSEEYFDYNSPDFFNRYKEFILYGDPSKLSKKESKIREYYNYLISNSQEEKAEQFLNDQIKISISNFKRLSFKPYKKIYEFMGITVFLDEKNVSVDFSENSKNMRDLKQSIKVMFFYVKDLIPNKKPKILITDVYKHKKTREDAITLQYRPAGFTSDKVIYIDQTEMDNQSVFVHELAHWVVDMIPSQTVDLLDKAFNDMLDFYYRLIKKRRIPTNEITDNMRRHMAKRLGFDSYGLTNKDEFFAVLIENWKTLPNNNITYKFKSTVKQILARL